MTKTTEKTIKLTLNEREVEVIKKALSEYWANYEDEDTATAAHLLQVVYRMTA